MAFSIKKIVLQGFPVAFFLKESDFKLDELNENTDGLIWEEEWIKGSILWTKPQQRLQSYVALKLISFNRIWFSDELNEKG